MSPLSWQTPPLEQPLPEGPIAEPGQPPDSQPPTASLRRVPWVLGHRGARHAAPENTLAAFELARVEGAVGSELDVQLTRDGRLFVVHDFALTRVTGGRDRRVVAQMSSPELERVRVQGDQPVPRLEAVIDWARTHGLLLNIELKSAHARRDRIAEATVELLRRYPDAERWACISSFHPVLVQRCSQALPQVQAALIVGPNHPCLLRPRWLDAVGARAVHPQAKLVLRRPNLRERIGSKRQINCWTVNDVQTARKLAQMGVHALISDCPGRLLQGLE